MSSGWLPDVYLGIKTDVNLRNIWCRKSGWKKFDCLISCLVDDCRGVAGVCMCFHMGRVCWGSGNQEVFIIVQLHSFHLMLDYARGNWYLCSYCLSVTLRCDCTKHILVLFCLLCNNDKYEVVVCGCVRWWWVDIDLACTVSFTHCCG